MNAPINKCKLEIVQCGYKCKCKLELVINHTWGLLVLSEILQIDQYTKLSTGITLANYIYIYIYFKLFSNNVEISVIVLNYFHET